MMDLNLQRGNIVGKKMIKLPRWLTPWKTYKVYRTHESTKLWTRWECFHMAISHCWFICPFSESGKAIKELNELEPELFGESDAI